jgi:hypothetical protein
LKPVADSNGIFPEMTDPESLRLRSAADKKADWKRWGTYLPERQWGTVREDYSPNGDSWRSFSHEDAVKRCFRWGEDGLLGWSDRKCRLAFSIALWNGKDPILKERLFGLTNPEGNHGEDVKELYYYLDATPTHSYCRALYKYPFHSFPYDELRKGNAERGFQDPEFELLDTGVFHDKHYADVQIEYAKQSPDDTCMRVTLHNYSDQKEELHVLGQLVFRNTWTWGCRHEGCTPRPLMQLDETGDCVKLEHSELKRFHFRSSGPADPTWLFTENESNDQELYGSANATEYTKDAFHRYVIQGEKEAVNPDHTGTKCAAVYKLTLPPGGKQTLHFRLTPEPEPASETVEDIIAIRREEMDQFYNQRFPELSDKEEIHIHRQAMAGMLWSKQFYHYSVLDWEAGDPKKVSPPSGRGDIRNGEWTHLFSRDILSMPDKWEYPWFAAWDTAFHMIPFAQMDPWFTRDQLMLFLREWYLHPNGQLPAYEFNFSDVNPPVHAWACREVYRQLKARGETDLDFLEQAFHKLLINFTWWVNRKDPEGQNIFAGGFLGLDNIGPFDRSHPPPGMDQLEQADGTAWMAFFCGVMLDMALEIAKTRPAYEGIASKFFEHFMSIADAMNHLGGEGLWEDADGFYYDHLRGPGESQHLPVRSMVGLIPLFAVLHLEDGIPEHLEGYRARTKWFLEHRRDILQSITFQENSDGNREELLAIPSRERLESVLRYVFDENEFLSPYGIRSLSKVHEKEPFEMHFNGQVHRVGYLPAESDSGMFGGNSNWRGPIWFPVNFLLIESLRTYHRFYGDSFQVEVPTGSGNRVNLDQAADEISRRLNRLFLPGNSSRPCHGQEDFYQQPENKELVLFYEYFHADNGRGCGASHQTGWTGLIATLLSSEG